MRQIRLLIAALLAMSPFVANADLIGATVDVDWFFPDSSTLYCSSGSATVGAGTEYPAGCSGFYPVSIDITGTQVFVTNSLEGGWAPGSFNGFVMSILSGPTILSASFNSGAMGFTSLAFDGTSVSFNFAGLGGGTSIFDIATSVPEPSTLALLGIGLIGMGLARRRRNV